MLLEDKDAVIYGTGGARVFLGGRTLAMLDEVAEESRFVGGVAATARAVAFDEHRGEENTSA